jgi:hypothetical protein
MCGDEESDERAEDGTRQRAECAVYDTIRPSSDLEKSTKKDVQHAYRFVERLRIMAIQTKIRY